MAAKDPITCHILDTTIGRPAKSVRVRLECSNFPVRVFESTTDEDGRIKVWQPCSSDKSAGEVPMPKLDDVLRQTDGPSSWTLRFDTAGYFGEEHTFFPEVVIMFRVQKGQHYHVPLLMSPYSYTTYRGS